MTMSPQLVAKVIFAGFAESGDAAGALAHDWLSGRAATGGVQARAGAADAAAGAGAADAGAADAGAGVGAAAAGAGVGAADAEAAGSALLRWLMNTTAKEPATSPTTTIAAMNFWRPLRRLALAARRSC